MVEIKRGRRGAPSARPAIAPKEFKLIDAKLTTLPERRPAPPPAAPALRRILDVIEPVIEHAKVEAAEKVETAAPLKPRRNRLPKGERVAKGETSASAPAPRKNTRGPRAPIEPSAPDSVGAAMRTAPPRETKVVLPATGRVRHGDRVEAATRLPRGERWKRRMSKVLW